MKLIIRDEKEDTCEIWLELRDGGSIHVMSRVGDGSEFIEVAFEPNLQASHYDCNFKWEQE